jgi:AcrR family transcriptional regulator
VSETTAAIPLRERLILAGISVIEESGVSGFSIRRTAAACGVSCAAPYRHIKDKEDLMTAIILYIKERWRETQMAVISEYEGDLKSQLLAVSLSYIRFLLDNPHFRSIIMIKDQSMLPEHVRLKSELSAKTRELIDAYCAEKNMPEDVRQMKTFVVRSLIYGAALMFDNGEIPYDDHNFGLIAGAIEREFEI